MKTMNKLIATAIVLVGFTANSFGQVSENMTASATILSPLNITNTQNLNFGRMAATGAAGTVVLAPTILATRNPTLVTLFTDATVRAASFDVQGAANALYTIDLSFGSVDLTGAGVDMTADNWTAGVDGSLTALGTLDAAGDQTFYVGATLYVNAAQAPGIYTSAPFPITIDYQ